jgi:hypothetical protein
MSLKEYQAMVSNTLKHVKQPDDRDIADTQQRIKEQWV